MTAAGVSEDAGPAGVGSPLRLPHPDWLHHRLAVIGPAETVAAFEAAAQGAGIIPWQLDRAQIEEDLFHRLVAPPPPHRRSLSLEGARALARQLCEAVALRHEIAMAQVGRGRACVFDLHVLVPVPEDILARGPDHPEALAWLWVHWGTTEALRHVVREPARALRVPLPAGTSSARYSFWSANWTPWRAVLVLRAQWPDLRFEVRPTYDAS